MNMRMSWRGVCNICSLLQQLRPIGKSFCCMYLVINQNIGPIKSLMRWWCSRPEEDTVVWQIWWRLFVRDFCKKQNKTTTTKFLALEFTKGKSRKSLTSLFPDHCYIQITLPPKNAQMSKSFNPTYHVECFTDVLDSFHMSIHGKSPLKCLEEGGRFLSNKPASWLDQPSVYHICW